MDTKARKKNQPINKSFSDKLSIVLKDGINFFLKNPFDTKVIFMENIIRLYVMFVGNAAAGWGILT